MGSFGYLMFAEYDLYEFKNHIDSVVLSLFQESDRNDRERLLVERPRSIWGDTYAGDATTRETTCEYRTTMGLFRTRLEIRGFTLERARAEYEELRQEDIEFQKECRDLGGSTELQPAYDERINVLSRLTFERYVTLHGELIRKGVRPDPWSDERRPSDPEIAIIMDHSEDFHHGFLARDVRSFFRVACEYFDADAPVWVDLTDLSEGGWCDSSEEIAAQARRLVTARIAFDTAVVVLTEGSTDAEILRRGLEALYPELVECFHFLDFFEPRRPGGATHLVNIMKAFASSSVPNKIVGVFDADSAAADVLRTIPVDAFPENVGFMILPATESLRSYPVIGPGGPARDDVNGRAASLELYLGPEALTNMAGEIVPVQWTGYIRGVDAYQGEVMDKRRIQEKFRLLVSQSSTAIARRDRFPDLDLVLRTLIARAIAIGT